MKIGVHEEKISIIKSAPNFVQHTNDKESLNKFRETLATPYEKIILFFGRLVENKGIKYLIQALPKITIPNVKLVIVGGGVLQKELKELTKNMSLDDKVIFYGRASDEDLGMLHGVSDVFVCPSIVDSQGITEGLGMVIPEAMESGLPVIATSVGGIADIVKHDINGILIEQKDPQAIAAAIDRIFSDQILRDTIVKNGKLTVNEFSHTLLADQYVDLFRTIIK
jgi:glycosyltransferase involved in cell wall biosynthesis